MNKSLSIFDINQIKIVAKRLKKHFPDNQHTKLLDIASHVMYGISSFHEAQKTVENPVQKVSHNKTYGDVFNLKPSFSQGDWHFYPQGRTLVFEGEFSPYTIAIDRLNDAASLLDFILQIQKKFWPQEFLDENDISPTYQVHEFISLMDELCKKYLKTSIQGAYSPGGISKEVVWPKDLIDIDNDGGQ